MSRNPYAQVALTYFRRPFSSSLGRLMLMTFLLMLLPLLHIGGIGKRLEFGLPHMMSFVFLFAYLVAHAKSQFVAWRSHLTPGYRRVHATVAAVVLIVSAVVLPTVLACCWGWHPVGLVAVAMLLLGTTAWVIVKDATWTCFAALGAWLALLSTEAGRAWFHAFVSGQIQTQAAAILIVGTLITLLAGIRLVRLSEETMTYDSTLRWDSEWSEKTRRGWNGDGRILPGPRDWLTEQRMASVTRHARRASDSQWSRICRWQTEMVVGLPFWFWMLGMLIFVHALRWLPTNPGRPVTLAMLGTTSYILIVAPTMFAGGIYRWRMFKLGYESSLPVKRKSYIRQLGIAAALSHFQLWGGMSAVLMSWWLLAGPRPLPLATLAGVLAFSAAFQIAVFGLMVWTSRYRSRAMVGAVLGVLLPAAYIMQLLWIMPPPLPYQVMWIAGGVVVAGLLITYDAYRRWLVADFD